MIARPTSRIQHPIVRLLMLMVLSGPGSAFAALFEDDFESGTLLTSDAPSGKWLDQQFAGSCPSPASCSIAAAPSAARRGGFGLEFVDSAIPTGGGTQGEVYVPVSAQANLFGRFWFRATQSNGIGSVVLTQVTSNNATSLVDFKLFLPEGQFELGGFDAASAYRNDRSPFVLDLNGWHLMEYQVQGVGTSTGAIRAWIDGVLKVQLSGINYTGLQLSQLQLGEPYSDDRRFAGKLQYDDFRVDTIPMASKWALTLPASTAVVGSCLPITASLQSSLSGALAPAPYSVVATLSNTGVAGSFFSDASCAVPATTLTVGAGAQTATTYYRPTGAGTASLSISHLDFLGTTAVGQISEVENSPVSLDGGIIQQPSSNPATCPATNPLCNGDIEVGSACGAGASGNGASTIASALIALLCLAFFRAHPGAHRGRSLR